MTSAAAPSTGLGALRVAAPRMVAAADPATKKEQLEKLKFLTPEVRVALFSIDDTAVTTPVVETNRAQMLLSLALGGVKCVPPFKARFLAHKTLRQCRPHFLCYSSRGVVFRGHSRAASNAGVYRKAESPVQTAAMM